MEKQADNSKLWTKKLGEGFFATFFGALAGAIGLSISGNNLLISALLSGIGAIIGILISEYLFFGKKTATDQKNKTSFAQLIAKSREERIALFLVILFSLFFHRLLINSVSLLLHTPPVTWDIKTTFAALDVTIFVSGAISSGILNAVKHIRRYGWENSIGEKIGDVFMFTCYTGFSAFVGLFVCGFFMLCAAAIFYAIKFTLLSFQFDLDKSDFGISLLGISLFIAELYGIKMNNESSWQMVG